MSITRDKVVCFHYLLKNEDGTVIESSHDGEPSIYLHGARNILPMLERALEGHELGDQLQVTLDALDAYGPYKNELLDRVAIKHLQSDDQKLREGSQVRMQTADGVKQVTVVKLGRYQATVDGNHPLAGKNITFVIEITAVRDATPDELTHGHAHGPDGTHTH